MSSHALRSSREVLRISGNSTPICTTFLLRKQTFCPELEKSTVCMDYPIRTISDSLEKSCCFYAEPVRNGSSAHHLTASPLKCYRKKQLPRAICITFHANFTIRPGGHSNFRCFPSFTAFFRQPTAARRPAFCSPQILPHR